MEDLQEDVAMERVVTAHRVRSIIIRFTTRLNQNVWIQAFREVGPLTADKINRRFS